MLPWRKARDFRIWKKIGPDESFSNIFFPLVKPTENSDVAKQVIKVVQIQSGNHLNFEYNVTNEACSNFI